LDTISDKNLQTQAIEELDEYKTAYNTLTKETNEVAALKLADLHQEYERDISALQILESPQFASLLPIDTVTSYFSES
jgi:hypothetical protein